ncbi:MAG: bacillithiol biosynthesis deacetylase BshB1 [Bacteroidetes bacterium]|nr:bacillithiol biosynthesis deacetylase BshB1 [Bacteroidota bacterium]
MKIDILAIGVHPDDVELSCAGTILKHIALGKTVGILDLTLGELGTRGNSELRTKEALNAAKLLGVSFRKQLSLKDGFFENNQSNLIPIIEIIRETKPEIVLANAVLDRHPDHGRAAKLTADACFYSGLSKIETVINKQQQIPWRPKALYHYIQDNYMEPDLVIDVTNFIDKKFAAINAFESQFFNPNSTEPITPISGEHYLDFVKSKMNVFGRAIGAQYAEGFIKSRTIGVNNLFDLI